MSIMILKDLFSNVTVDAFTFEHNICEFFPIRESIHYVPLWWKNLPKERIVAETDQRFPVPYPQSTMKRCTGFTDLYKKSFTMPLWADVVISSNDQGEFGYKSSWNDFKIESHDRHQYGPMFDNFIHLKILSTWLLKEKTGVKFYFTDPMWNNPESMNHFFIAEGMMDYKYQCATHVNAFINKTNANLMLKAGDPLIRIIPMTEKKVKVKCHTVTTEEHKKIWDEQKRDFWFTHTYNNFKKALESKK